MLDAGLLPLDRDPREQYIRHGSVEDVSHVVTTLSACWCSQPGRALLQYLLACPYSSLFGMFPQLPLCGQHVKVRHEGSSDKGGQYQFWYATFLTCVPDQDFGIGVPEPACQVQVMLDVCSFMPWPHPMLCMLSIIPQLQSFASVSAQWFLRRSVTGSLFDVGEVDVIPHASIVDHGTLLEPAGSRHGAYRLLSGAAIAAANADDDERMCTSDF